MAHTIEQVRNFALSGHNGAGKTSLAEAVAYNTGQLTRLGRVQEGSTVSDYDPEEIDRQMSIRMSLLSGDWNSHYLTVIDTPGYADFMPETFSALRVSDCNVVVVDSHTGVEVGTERVWKYAEQQQLSQVVFVNKMDRPEIDLDQIKERLSDRFGRETIVIQHPVNHGEGFNQLIDLVDMKLLSYKDGSAEAGDIPPELQETATQLQEQLVEAIAETDEALMEQYFEDGLSPEQIKEGLRKAVKARALFPVLFGDALHNVGVDRLLAALVDYCPSPAESSNLILQEAELEPNPAAHPVAYVFKTVVEQHVGELSVMRLYSGSLNTGDEVVNASRSGTERIGQMFRLNGHERVEVKGATAGDIVALVKLKNTHSGDVLCSKGQTLELPAADFPDPLIRVAVTPKEKGSEDRMVSGLAHLHEEDPGFVFRYDGEIRQSVLAAQGDLHLETILKRLKDRAGVEVETESPRIPYKETIRGSAESHYRHKKQTGGRGQFGEVSLKIGPKPRGEGFEFINATVGGSIPSNFIPAVEKGIRESLVVGPLSGSNVEDVEVTILDGKHHPVDSDEVSFKLASSHAFREAFLKAKPILLEPIYSLTITVPEEFMGEVMGDLTSRRGRISGTEADGHFQIVRADVPLAEIDRYATRLRSMTQGKGVHTQTLERYEDVPADVQSKIVEAATSEKEAA